MPQVAAAVDASHGPQARARVSTGYAVRAIDHRRAADRELVLAILREYFATVPGGEDTDARYEWLYLDNPHGVARTYVAVASEAEGGGAVGITSLFPRLVQVGARRRVGAIGGDAFVTPRFRRRGIVTALHRMALDELDDGLSFMFGPPEPTNLKALLQAGARVTGAVRRYRRPLSLEGLGRTGTVLAPATGLVSWALAAPRSSLVLEPLGHAPDPRVDVVWQKVEESVAATGAVAPVRDAAFYAWRFGRCPSGCQRGFLVLDGTTPVAAAAIERSDDGRAAILDVTCAPARTRSVLRALLHACRDASAVEIQVHAPSPRLEATLVSLAFVPRATKSFQVQSKPEESEPLGDASAWHYMWGDGDVVRVL